jgi:hypothetical protein
MRHPICTSPRASGSIKLPTPNLGNYEQGAVFQNI